MNVHPARRALLAVVVALTAGVLGACSEKLASGAACPALCPGQNVVLQDTILPAAIVLDTTVVGYPARGDEAFLLVADRGSDLQSRAVVRFDTLTTKFNRSATDTGVAISEVFGSNLRLIVDSTGSIITAPVTVNVYDVDTSAPDEDDAAVLAQFTPSRLIGSATFAVEDAKDTLVVPLSDAAVLAKITGSRRLRVGLQVTSSAPVQLKIYAIESNSSSARLRYDPTATTDSVNALEVVPRSASPAGAPTVAAALRDYTIVAGGPRPLESDALGVGGLPARRVYLRFDLPKWLLDSSTVVRATLLLTQRPVANADSTTAITVLPAPVLASTDVVDVGRAASIVADTLGGITALALAPKDSGVRVVELGTLLRRWRTVKNGLSVQHAVVLRSGTEGAAVGEVRFFSSKAAADTLRPRLRVTYVPRIDFGVP